MGGLAEATRKPAAERLPGVETVHIADSGLVGGIIRAGVITPMLRRCVPVWKRRCGYGCHRMRLYTSSGTYAQLVEHYGISEKDIAQKVRNTLGKA